MFQSYQLIMQREAYPSGLVHMNSELCELRLPGNLVDLLMDMSREILREQPRDIIAFATAYTEQRLQDREDSKAKSIITF